MNLRYASWIVLVICCVSDHQIKADGLFSANDPTTCPASPQSSIYSTDAPQAPFSLVENTLAAATCPIPASGDFQNSFSANSFSCRVHGPMQSSSMDVLNLVPQPLQSGADLETSSSCDVGIGFNLINKVGVDLCLSALRRSNTAFDAEQCPHHAYVHTRSGEFEFASRGGPDPNALGGFGNIRMQVGPYVPGFIDYQSKPDAFMHIATIPDPGCKETNAQLVRHAAEVNAARIPYIFYEQNSNSAAVSGVVNGLGICIDLEAAPVSAPGIATRLNIPTPSSSSDLGLYGLPSLDRN